MELVKQIITAVVVILLGGFAYAGLKLSMEKKKEEKDSVDPAGDIKRDTEERIKQTSEQIKGESAQALADHFNKIIEEQRKKDPV